MTLIEQVNPTLRPSEEELNAYLVLAKKSFKEKLSLTQKAIEDNQKFATIVKSPINSEEMLAKGTIILGAQFAMASAFIHTWIYTSTPLHFPDMDVRFNADVWGVGIGGGTVWLSGWMPETGASILGDVNFVISTTPTITEIAFMKGCTTVGILIGGGLNVQVGGFAGVGTFSKM